MPPALPAALDQPQREADDGAIFDLLVLYTPAARTAAGGTDGAIQSRINLGVTETNTAYANSGIVPRLRLVGAELVSYTESSDLGLDLDAVTGSSDGLMDAVHARRDALGADLVQAGGRRHRGRRLRRGVADERRSPRASPPTPSA